MGTVVTQKKRTSPDKPDKRKKKRNVVFGRYPVFVRTVEMKNADLAPIPGMLTDISRSGLGLVLGTRIAPGSGITVIMRKGNSAQEIQLEGQAVWVNPLPSTGHIIKPGAQSLETWRIGVKLNTEDADQNAIIEDLIKSAK